MSLPAILGMTGLLFGTLAVARRARGGRQPVAPPPPPGATLDTRTRVSLPPDFARRVESAAKRADPVALENLAAQAAAMGAGKVATAIRKTAKSAGLPPAPKAKTEPSLVTPKPPLSAKAVLELPQRIAAKELTGYLAANGGLRFRGREDRKRVTAWQIKLGLKGDGLYGRKTALAVADQGIVPVVPFYWPRTAAKAAKAEFRARIQEMASADPARAGQWAALLEDLKRS